MRRLIQAALLAALWAPMAAPFAAAAEVYPFRGASLGPRFTMFKPEVGGDWVGSGGLQLRLHMTPTWALEASGDYRRRRFAPDTRVDIYPIQASLLAYLFPNAYHLSPYLLAGAGWYFTHVDAPTGSDTNNRFGPHVGAGLELFLNDKWSLDTDYRHFWLEDIHASGSVLNQTFSDESHQVTGAINYHF